MSAVEQRFVMPELCTFPACTNGDTSLDAYRACDRCLLYPRQYAAHVKAWEEYQFRRRVGLMVLQPYPIVAVQHF